MKSAGAASARERKDHFPRVFRSSSSIAQSRFYYSLHSFALFDFYKRGLVIYSSNNPFFTFLYAFFRVCSTKKHLTVD